MPPSRSRPAPDPRRRAERAGRSAETLAGWLLRLKLYRIVATRYKTPVGEIDIVAQKGRRIVFIEVKQRSGSRSARDQALASVNTARIVRCAEWFQSAHPAYQGYDFRFDVITLAPGRWPHHLVNAFTA
jgi:putative endonuclease|tara:strand:- start:510 stop:896 length:387 start_codon:yes stop_codon:yes gene_type:complete